MRHFQPRFYPPDRLARDIVRGMDRDAALVIAPISARVAWRLSRYTPYAADRMVRRELAWARATFTTDPAGANPACTPAAGTSTVPVMPCTLLFGLR